MSTKKLNLEQFLDLIDLEAYRGIINKEELFKTMLSEGIPKAVTDIRGALRLAIARDGNSFAVTEYATELSDATLNEIR